VPRGFPDAYTFECALDLEGILAVLAPRGLPWSARDADDHGDYLNVRLPDNATRLRILRDNTRFVLDIRSIASHPSAMDPKALDEVVFTEVLLPIGATAIAPAPAWD
jgi:hypothetical protein